jgi:hydrogenase maturation protein HypF
MSEKAARRFRVTGVVQGVGFRPFVWRLARELGLAGWVRNDAAGVDIHAEGLPNALDELAQRMRADAPPLASVDAVHAKATELADHTEFAILESTGGKVSTAIGHDTAICDACLAELFDPGKGSEQDGARGRRYRHAFITCTHCGPRYTVTRRLPYDRPQTSLAPFPFCPDCAREYADPADRRFHAETTCCPNCGPQLTLLDAARLPIFGDPIAATLALLREGKIVAIKGLGGFHLACDASNARTVATLRERKQREEKPFAVMVASAAHCAPYAKVGAGETALLTSPERPVVLMAKQPGADARLPGCAPGLAEIGLMLPATPIQFLIFHDAPDMALVMTSANPHGEPLVTGNDEAFARLAGIADAFLLHDRDIVIRCDDSVRRGTGFVRRARGYVPRSIRLPHAVPSTLAVGGWFKNTVCVTRGDEAFVSQHVGDLDNAAACGFFEEAVEHLLAILEVEPEIVAHDLHPDFHSTRFALDFVAARGIPAVGVQHHHAHIAAVCAERGIVEPVIGLALDGVGLGSDGAAWGGELLRVDGALCERLSHLHPLALPGGDVAAREPWRMAASALHALGRHGDIYVRFKDEAGATTVATMLERGLHCPPTSSAGRLFDAAAGLLEVKRRASFEGQAAMLLEGLAATHGPAEPLAGGWRIAADGTLDLRPLLAHLVDLPPERLDYAAALFHSTFAAALAEWAAAACARSSIATVVGAGGCFLNRLLADALSSALGSRGLHFVTAQALPPNDGGLSLGQAWAASPRAPAGPSV